MADKVKCSQGHENPVSANFCGTCREKIVGGLAHCPHCGVANDSGSKFCKQCGKSMDTEPKEKDEPSAIEGMKWRRGINDFATRIDAEDLQGIFKKGLVVEQGTKALLLMDGTLEELPPGRYDCSVGLWDKIKHLDLHRTATAILIDSGDVELYQDITGIYTNDPLNIDVTCKVISQIADANLFFNNVMKDRSNYLISELKSSLYDELKNVFNEVIGKKSVADLNSDLSLKHQFEDSVENHLKSTFQRNGLTFIQLRTIDYRFKGYDKVRGIYEEAYLQVSEDEAKLQGRKRLFDVFDKKQLQDIFENTRKADHYEKRIDVWQRLRELANSDKMNEIKSADDFDAFVQDIDKGKLLREDEIESLKNTFSISKKRREFLVRKIELEQGLEYESMGLVGKEEIELKRFEAEAKRKRRVLEENLKIKSAERELEVEEAKTDGTVKDIERETHEKDMELGLKGLKAVKEAKMKEKRDEMDIEAERLERLSEAKMKAKRDEMDIEAERLERLSKVGIEALITTASNKDQAKILAELKKTEMLKGLPEEQILAMGARESDALAKAFQEKFKGLSAEKQESLYKEMIADKDKSTKIMQEMFNKALDTQRDASVAAAQSGQPNVVFPPSGHSPIYTTPVAPAGVTFIICPKCNTKGSKGEYCNNCGNEIS